MNVGSTTPTDYGYYISWGETRPYSDDNYSERNNKYYSNGNVSLPTKYTGDDRKFKLDQKDDPAYSNWGSGWRTPTVADFKELCENTAISLEKVDGVYVYRFKSKRNSSSIIIPCGGYKSYLKHYAKNEGLYVLSCELNYNYTSDSFYKTADYIACMKAKGSKVGIAAQARYCGVNVRPVYGSGSNSSGQSNNDNNTSNDALDLTSYDITPYPTTINAKFYFNNSLKSAKITYGTTSSCSSSASTVVGSKIASASITGLKKNTRYYIKCTATDKNGSTYTTSAISCTTEP